ncbi:YkgJ family cysteine cluster protein [Tautonia plasticadhaerens]|uniref:Flagellin N-methylase n=1 Tax=Tautonia plasticadhaerens TaxID=2527974 RepID=A0A518HDK8_9BACT|nr:YkgJ family cysteine cluster protein [Tautonia plasticadhaerens]QDV38942.1 Flagellin N-methylase [Tautonia plasticadhaerens]
MSRRTPSNRFGGRPRRARGPAVPGPTPNTRRPPESVSARVELEVGGTPIGVEFEVPTGPVPPEGVLPVFRALTDAIVAESEREVEAQGRAISCRKGCGACCRQLVPVAEAEARALRDLIGRMPEPRRSEVLRRFAEARRRLDEAGLLELLLHPERTTVEQRRALGPDYFRLGIPCPFLEEESCSIHPERPLACREYLVTSPAEDCADPTPERIRRVELPIVLSGLLSRFGSGPGGPGTTWVALVVAPGWAEEQAEGGSVPLRPGPDRVRELFRLLAGEDPQGPPPGLGEC